ncbi:MAG: hypothetical protein IT214_02210 [Chitinophagaceae bacterium]|nr:hypothetical protein [Chitinophagaceae bacterium]OQY94013.1 MAG: hypothetical protein B6D37_09770 [Sphingobacteriales bacterium UTBCD1]
MKKRILTVAALSILGIAIAMISCNSNKSNNNAQQKSSGSTSKVDTVIISGMQFQPAQLTVSTGDTVIWINKDIVTHNVTDSLNAWTSGNIDIGNSWKSAPQKSFNYFCSIHPTMKGSVTVVNK